VFLAIQKVDIHIFVVLSPGLMGKMVADKVVKGPGDGVGAGAGADLDELYRLREQWNIDRGGATLENRNAQYWTKEEKKRWAMQAKDTVLDMGFGSTPQFANGKP